MNRYNRYLSSRERESMARLMALVMVEGEAIKSYEKVSDLDKEFMKYLRMSHTFLEKAIARRYNLIDLDAAKQMKRAASQLCVVFVPEREARRRVEEVARMKKTLHLSMSDFEDLCESKKSSRKMCPIRTPSAKKGGEHHDDTRGTRHRGLPADPLQSLAGS